ncbi:hypothetical protein HGM15179_011005 [Zosterops borbonicus]|uniref:Uncharacterized protein n=1 Tax=Zosterops borbonicus TaxID=364589 RepID=A0A8K1GDG6_9PASS|nr:hypothetical protein HGM15179_011005 [Zosterops borbonicus]
MLNFSPLSTPQVLPRAVLNPFSIFPMFVLGIAISHMQNLALSLVALDEVHSIPPLQTVQVPLNDIPSLQHKDKEEEKEKEKEEEMEEE